jgi:hypothetical protein
VTDSDAAAYAQLWLSELGAAVPEHHDGDLPPGRETQFGLHLTEQGRARRHSRRLEMEGLRVRTERRA